MPHVSVNGIRLAYRRSGTGPNVLMIMGSSASGQAWTMHQTPALNAAGYRTVEFDHRGVAPSDAPAGRYRMEDMVADTKGLIEALNLAPVAIVGVSLGSLIAQELAARHPELVRCAVLLATRARGDAVRIGLSAADRALAMTDGVRPPAAYLAVRSALRLLSPATLADDAAAAMWLEIFEISGDDGSVPGHDWIDTTSDRRAMMRAIAAPCRVVAFSDDLVSPPHLGAEVADLIPDCDYVELPDCGHIGYLERPDAVNAAILEFLGKHA